MRMRMWKTIVLVLGILLLTAAFLAYLGRVTSCYPVAGVWQKFSSEQVRAFREACNLNAPPQVQFALFLWLFVPGVVLFTAYWILSSPRVTIRRNPSLGTLLLLLMMDSLLVTVLSLLDYPAPFQEKVPAAWISEVTAGLGFLSYASTLALWHWKRWGLLLFQGVAIALAALVLLAGGSLILAVFLILGVIILTLLLRPLRRQMT